MGLHYRFSLTVLASSIGGERTCSSSIDGPESSSLCTVSTMLLQTLTDCTFLAVTGKGLQQIESTYQSCIVMLNCYLADSSDPFMQMIRECDSGKFSHTIKRMACRFTVQLQRNLASGDKLQNLHSNASISVEGGFEQAPETDARHYRTCCSSLRVRSWNGKPMHGQYRRLTEQPPVDMKETYKWLKTANLPAATEGLVVAAQEQALWTRHYERKILHRDVSPTCRMYSVGLETVDHIVAGCRALAPMNYTN